MYLLATSTGIRLGGQEERDSTHPSTQPADCKSNRGHILASYCRQIQVWPLKWETKRFAVQQGKGRGSSRVQYCVHPCQYCVHPCQYHPHMTLSNNKMAMEDNSSICGQKYEVHWYCWCVYRYSAAELLAISHCESSAAGHLQLNISCRTSAAGHQL